MALGRRPTLSTTEAGQRLHVSHETVRRYYDAGLLEGYLTRPNKGGRLRVYVDSVEELLQARKSRESHQG
jgi:predicted site-specific integrase-resolvase